MARKKQFHGKQRKQNSRSSYAPPPVATRPPAELKAPVQYGKPFTIMEDEMKNTFEYSGGKWMPYEMSIAECRLECQVNELPQKVNRMTRYEIRRPVLLGS